VRWTNARRAGAEARSSPAAKTTIVARPRAYVHSGNEWSLADFGRGRVKNKVTIPQALTTMSQYPTNWTARARRAPRASDRLVTTNRNSVTCASGCCHPARGTACPVRAVGPGIFLSEFPELQGHLRGNGCWFPRSSKDAGGKSRGFVRIIDSFNIERFLAFRNASRRAECAGAPRPA